MAVELYQENNSNKGISPRISFSHDLNQSDIIPIEPNIPLKSSLIDIDFKFCINRRSHDQEESSMADELFANGIILPLQIKKKKLPIKSKSLNSSSPPLFSPLPISPVSNIETEEKQGNGNNKSFWMFKRSKSLNCGSIYSAKFCSLPLLSRSKSTGSTNSVKKSLILKDDVHHHGGFKQNSQKTTFLNHGQKPPLKKNYGSSSFNSRVVQVSPILNVPSGKFLGFGSIFSSGKDKGKKK